MTDIERVESLDVTQLAASGRAGDPQAMAARVRWRGVWYYCETSLRTMRAYGWSVVMIGVGQPLFYLVAMGIGLGALISANGQQVDGVSYLVFVAPAVMVATLVSAAAGELTYPVMAGFRWRETYFGPAATPTSPSQIAMGHLLAVALRFLAQAVVFWALMLLFGATHTAWSLATIPIATVTAVAFGAPLQAYSATLEKDGLAFNFVQRFIVVPMMLFSGTYFPLSAMPWFLQWIGWISPVWHGAQLARWASYGAAPAPWLAAVHVGYLLALVVLGAVLSCRIYTRRLLNV